ncbi:hypothetical protein AX17_002587 [Amanita inopinata Kibby_2008]|nr:hypothetical protein AX17_002587 [Amanita inopinata Kibby_2008]
MSSSHFCQQDPDEDSFKQHILNWVEKIPKDASATSYPIHSEPHNLPDTMPKGTSKPSTGTQHDAGSADSHGVQAQMDAIICKIQKMNLEVMSNMGCSDFCKGKDASIFDYASVEAWLAARKVYRVPALEDDGTLQGYNEMIQLFRKLTGPCQVSKWTDLNVLPDADGCLKGLRTQFFEDYKNEDHSQQKELGNTAIAIIENRFSALLGASATGCTSLKAISYHEVYEMETCNPWDTLLTTFCITKDISRVIEALALQEPTTGKCDAIVVYPICHLSPSEGNATFLQEYPLIKGTKANPLGKTKMPLEMTIEENVTPKPLKHTEVAALGTYNTLLPTLVVEYKKDDAQEQQARHQATLYCISAVTFLSDALNIYDYPVFGLVGTGQRGLVFMAWRSSKNSNVYLIDPKNGQEFDICKPLEAFWFIAFLIQMMFHYEEKVFPDLRKRYGKSWIPTFEIPWTKDAQNKEFKNSAETVQESGKEDDYEAKAV